MNDSILNKDEEIEIEQNFSRISDILSSGIFDDSNLQQPLLQSALIELLIRVNDLVTKSRLHTDRINFDDDIVKNNEVNDITDLIKYTRDAVCLPNSENHYIEGGVGSEKKRFRFSFNMMRGEGILTQINEKELSSDYEDDICFFFGPQKIYLHRHIIRAYKAAKNNLTPIMENK